MWPAISRDASMPSVSTARAETVAIGVVMIESPLNEAVN